MLIDYSLFITNFFPDKDEMSIGAVNLCLTDVLWKVQEIEFSINCKTNKRLRVLMKNKF